MNAAEQRSSDVPLVDEYDPAVIPFHLKVLTDIRCNFSYRDHGVHQILLSGSVGSGKSLLGAHAILTHCFENPGAVVGIGRLTMPDLKDTLLQMILDHLGEDGECVEYSFNKTKSEIVFPNKSKIMSFSWHDKKYKKFRSHKFSMFVIEELTENDTKEAIEAIIQRLGRLTNIQEKVLLCMTNPDDPEHWAYDWFIERAHKPNIHVYYSLTEENPFLDKNYVQNLKENLDPVMARRMLYGEWVSVGSDNIYYNYLPERNLHEWEYKLDLELPIRISFDFNIGVGKPMSCVLGQYNGAFHFYEEVVLEGSRTADVMEELAQRDLLDEKTNYIIHGDQTGKSRDTRGTRSDYDIIEEFLTNYRTKDGRKIYWEFDIPTKNPPVRERHNIMNGLMYNTLQQVRFYVYSGAKTLHKGLRLTKLKKGGQYIEDDSKREQHITTAAGYMVCSVISSKGRKKQATVQL